MIINSPSLLLLVRIPPHIRLLSTIIISVMTITAISSCRHVDVIDSKYPWTSSGIPTADSLFFQAEQLGFANGLMIEKLARHQELTRQLHQIATQYPENLQLKIQLLYLDIIGMDKTDKKKRHEMLNLGLKEIDSLQSPYEYHMFLSLLNEDESDYVKKYSIALSNLAYFSSVGCKVDMGRVLVCLGNVMLGLQDSLRAKQYFESAETIFKELKLRSAFRTCVLNRAVLELKPRKDSIYWGLLNDPTIETDPYNHVLILHNLFLSTDSLPLMEKAINLYNSYPIDHRNYPMALGLIGHHHMVHGNPQQSLEYILMAIDSAGKYTPDNFQNYQFYNNILADAYYFLDEKDSCIEALSRARVYNDLKQQQQGRARIYATDAAARIRLVEQNARLEKQREIAVIVIGFLMLTILLLWLIFRMRRRQADKQHEEALMQERHERNLQSIRAQSKVMEESDRMIESIEEKIDEMKGSSKISEESAESLNRLLRIHKSNEENRQGFLKVQQELDTRFRENIKIDFPNLSETQIKLASLIAAGLDSRQIGSILNIEQASVHKSRYRLRTRLGLSKDQSLEEFLRRYNRPLP